MVYQFYTSLTSVDIAQYQSSREEGVYLIIHRYFFLFFNENICCDPSLEPSTRDGSNDGSQNMF